MKSYAGNGIEPATLLRLALDGDAQTCMAEVGVPRHLVIQQALHLADDPAVALEHPELVRRVRERVSRQRQARAWPSSSGASSSGG